MSRVWVSIKARGYDGWPVCECFTQKYNVSLYVNNTRSVIVYAEKLILLFKTTVSKYAVRLYVIIQKSIDLFT